MRNIRRVPFTHDDDDDKEISIPLKDIIISGLPPCIAIYKSTRSRNKPMSMLTESEDAFDSEFDLPVCDDFPKSRLVTFSNPLFDIDDDCTSSDDESFSDEDVPMENFKFYLYILCLMLDEESISYRELNVENSIESFSPSPILVEDIDSLMEEIDVFLASDGSIPPGIENDNYDSEGDILFLEEFLSNNSLSLPETESFHFDHYDVPSPPRPPAKPPDDGIFFDFDPDTGVLTAKVVGDISEHYVLMPRLLPTQSTLAINDEKSPHLLSHRGFKTFQLFSKIPMMIYGGYNPILNVPFLHFYPP
ncbi:hypothetical protein Tco_1224792 [Tanacetum coccineum]